MDKKVLMDAASLRRGTVDVLGQTIHYTEPSVGVQFDYLRIRNGIKNEKGDFVVKPDIDGAVAMLIQRCTQDEKGTRLFTDEEALSIAKGSQRVAAPLLSAILGDDEKSAAKNGEAPSANSSSH
jgi:hypothetical protein